MPTDRITVVLADDHALVRRGFRRLLEDDPELAVVGEASNGEEAIALAASLKPHVIVMDAAMPGPQRHTPRCGDSGRARCSAILASLLFVCRRMCAHWSRPD